MKRKLLIAGGGTGGHVLPGIALANSWMSRWGSEGEVVFLGSRGGIEEKLVPRAGFKLELLKLGPLKRVSLFQRLKTLLLLPGSFIQSLLILLKYRPHAVVGVGGFASGPGVLLASILKYFGFKSHTAIVNPEAVVGFTNRMLSKWVDRVFCNYEQFSSAFEAKKVLVTGYPVRQEMVPLGPAPIVPFRIFVFGGSQGALGMNTLVLGALQLLKSEPIEWIHQTGTIDFHRVKSAYTSLGINARIEPFIYDMVSCYRESSLLICRAGASTLAEIAAVGRASLLVPLPTAADNHQYNNAKIFHDAGASILVNQLTEKAEDLAKLILELIRDPSRIRQMEGTVARFYRPNAAKDMVEALKD